MSKVFVSYSHESAEHNDRVLEFANALRSHGVNVELDRYHVRPTRGWPHWCEEQLRPENSDFVLMICTETYLKRVQNQVPPDEGHGVFWEGSIIYNYIYDVKANQRFIPVLLDGATKDCVPLPIREQTLYHIHNFDLGDTGYQELYRELTGRPLVTKPALGPELPLPVHSSSAAAKALASRPVRTSFPIIADSSVLRPRPTEGSRNRKTRISAAIITAAAGIIAGTIAVCSRAPVTKDPGTITSSPNHDLSGRILNAETGLPVPNADVSLDGAQQHDYSDSTGSFLLKLPTGVSSVRIRTMAPGFEPYVQFVAIETIPSTGVLISLQRKGRATKTPSQPLIAAEPHDAVTRHAIASVPPAQSSATSMLNPALRAVNGEDGPWAAIILGDHQERRDDVVSAVRSALGGIGHDTVSLFRKVADEQRLAADLFRGNSGLFQDLQAGRYCSRVLAGRLSVVTQGTTEGVTIARATLTVHVLSPSGELLKSFDLVEKGGGGDSFSAQRRAIDELIEGIPRDLPGHIN